MTKFIRVPFAGAMLLLAFGTSANDNPFAFKPKAPEVPQVPVVQQLPEKRQLSDIQRQQVNGIVTQAVIAATKGTGAFKDVENVVVLKAGEQVTSISSGMYVVYNSETEEFSYYDTQKYSSVISQSEYDKRVAEKKQLIQKAVVEVSDKIDFNDLPSQEIQSEQPSGENVTRAPRPTLDQGRS